MKLYDALGREVDVERLREEQAAPTMSGVRNIYSSMHPSVGLTPERLTQILREAEFGDPFLYLELAEEMEEKDLHYLAVLNTRKEAVSQIDYEIKPASEYPRRLAGVPRWSVRCWPTTRWISPARWSIFSTRSERASPPRRSCGTARIANGFRAVCAGAIRAGSCSTGSPAKSCWSAV